ncbi:type II toxin-antitoxin system PemK/MazF family toxin [candidate division WOR-3 bacterium]|nr:type II toxin-antitoxin system PemK/MazF family toxin [candidate division WOR-3 bacterium]
MKVFRATTIIAAITTTIKIYPVTMFLKAKSAGLSENSMINLAQILTVDKSRLHKKLGQLTGKQMVEVDKALRISLGLLY